MKNKHRLHGCDSSFREADCTHMNENARLPKAIYHVYIGSKKGRKTVITGDGETLVFSKDGCLKLTVIAETAEEASDKSKIFATGIGVNKHVNAPTSAMYFFVEPQRFEDLVVLSVEWISTIDIGE